MTYRVLLISCTFVLASCVLFDEGVVPNPDYREDASTAGKGGSGGSSASGGSGGTSGVGGTGGSAGDGGMNADAEVDGGDSGSPEGGAGEGGPDPCDETGSPKTESCLVSDAYAAFVAPDGAPGALGTIDAPVPTIAAGIAAAQGRDLRFVVVCGGDYTEPLVVTTGKVEVYGGFACDGDEWRWDADEVTRVRPSSGVALTIQDVADAIVIESVVFESADATDAGANSIAAVIASSLEVTLRRVTLIAGAGANGQNASTTSYNFPNRATELDGNGATGLTGGPRKLAMCEGGGGSAGGKGGDGGGFPENGTGGTPGLGAGAAGIAGQACAGSGTGGDGVDGPDGDIGAGALTLGRIDSRDWLPASGLDAEDGSPGQGGGGGAGTASGGGGGGGAGGCGGRGGASGQGGGASVALLSLGSTVSVVDSVLTARDAGDGGDGSAGQQGQQEGGFPGLQTANACSGGSGGHGGSGGAGGGGAGGISVGVLYVGENPELVATSITTGDAGARGQGGAPGTNDGLEGVTQDELEAP